MDKELLGNLRTYSEVSFGNDDSAKELIVQDAIKKDERGINDKASKVEIKERDEWSGLAEFLGNIIAKYAETVELDSLPEPDKYLVQKRVKGIYKKYMELSKLQRKNVKWVDYPNIWC